MPPVILSTMDAHRRITERKKKQSWHQQQVATREKRRRFVHFRWLKSLSSRVVAALPKDLNARSGDELPNDYLIRRAFSITDHRSHLWELNFIGLLLRLITRSAWLRLSNWSSCKATAAEHNMTVHFIIEKNHRKNLLLLLLLLWSF